MTDDAEAVNARAESLALSAMVTKLDETEAETGNLDRDTMTRMLLGLLSVLDPDGVSREMLDSVPVGESAPQVGTTELINDVISWCVGQSAITASGDQSALKMDALMRRAVREKREAEGDLPALAKNTIDLIRSLRFDELEAWQRRADGNRVIAHIDEFWATGIVEKCDQVTAADALAHRNWATRQLVAASDADRALVRAKQVVADAGRMLGHDHAVTLEAHHNLANALLAIGLLDSAIKVHEENLANCESLLGWDDPATMESRDSLGESYIDNEEFDRGIALHAKNLRLRMDLFGPDDRRTLSSRCNLSVAFRRGYKRDLVGEMVSIYRDDLADRERVLGVNHPDSLESSSSLAVLYDLVGRLDDSGKLFESTLVRSENALGRGHPISRATRSALAGAYLDNGRIADAVGLREIAVDIAERALGADHRDTLRARLYLVIACGRAGRSDIVPRYEAVVGDCERILGSEDPDTLDARNSLAMAYGRIGRHDRQIEIHEVNLAARERVLGSRHFDTRRSRRNLASAYREVGSYDKAIKLYKAVVSQVEQTFPSGHPEILEARSNLAYAFRESGRTAAAITLLESVVEEYERTVGLGSPATMNARNKLAVAYGDTGRLVDAIKLYKSNLGDRERVLGLSHPDTIQSRSNLAYAYRKTDCFAESVALYEDVAADLERTLPQGHPKILEARGNLAFTCWDAGRSATAVHHFATIVTDRTRIQGPDHIDTLVSRQNLASHTGRAGDPASAAQQFNGLIADHVRVHGPDHRDTLHARGSLVRWLSEDPELVAWLEKLAAAHVLGRASANPDQRWLTGLVARYPMDLLAFAIERGARAAVDARPESQAGQFRPEALAAHLVDRVTGFLAGHGVVCDGKETRWLPADSPDSASIRSLGTSIRELSEDSRIVVWLEMLMAAHLVGRPAPNPDRQWLTGLISRYPMELLSSAVERRVRAAVDAQYPRLAACFQPEALAAHLVDRAKGFLVGQGIVCDGDEIQWHAPDYLEYTEILSGAIQSLSRRADPSEQFLGATEWLNLKTTWPLIVFNIK